MPHNMTPLVPGGSNYDVLGAYLGSSCLFIAASVAGVGVA
jgi:hypothetical protein